MDSSPLVIATPLPGRDQGLHSLNGWDTLLETLANQDGKLKLGHVEPTSMFGREMKLELAGNPMSFKRVKDFVQDSQSMGVEIVKYQPDQLGIREMHVGQVFEPIGEVGLGTAFGQLQMTPAAQGLKGNEQVTSAVPLIFMVNPPCAPRPHGQWFEHITQQLAGTLVGTHPGISWVKRQGIHRTSSI